MQEFVKNKKLYHLVDSKYRDSRWKEDNEFIIDNSYESFAAYYFSTKPILRFDSEYSLNEKITQARNEEISKEDLTKLANLVQHYLRYSPVLLREYILESVRLREFPQYISRAHCLYLTDRDSLKFWKNELSDYDLYKVEVTGNLFSSYECLLPQRTQSLLTQEYQARCYWKDSLDDYLKFMEHDINDREYLFQGNVKVLKKMNK